MHKDKQNKPEVLTRSLRPRYITIFLVALIATMAALFFQIIVSPAACPLCLFQRNIFIFIALTFIIAIVHNSISEYRRVYAFLLLIASFLGAVFAGRHAWLQYNFHLYPPDCGPSLDVLMSRFPFIIFIERIYQGKADCTEVVTTFLQLPLPFWSFFIFAGLVIYSLILLVRNK